MITPANSPHLPPHPPLDPPWGRLEVLKAIVLIVVGAVLLTGLAALMTAFFGRATVGAGLRSPLLFTVGVGIYAIVVIAVYLFAIRRPGSSWSAAGVRTVPWWWVPVAPLLLFVQLAGMALVNLWITPLFIDGEFENPQIEALTGGLQLTLPDLLLLLLLVAVVAPLAEELFFRGMIYPVMRRHWGVSAAILLNALLFAVVHFIPILIPGLFFIGLVLTWTRERSGSILPGVLVHALQNGLVVFGIYTMAGGL